MSSMFYARYIPPEAEEYTAPIPESKQKQQKSKKRKREAKIPTLSAKHSDQKHSKVREKFEKAREISSKASLIQRPGEDEGDTKGAIVAEEESVEKHDLVPLPQPEEVPNDTTTLRVTLPPWLAKPVVASSTDVILFEKFDLSDASLKALAAKNYLFAFAIQSAAIPMLLPGPGKHAGDICISASTGSGKTLAYVLPMIEDLRRRPVRQLRGLIIVPTRELVNQVRETLLACASGSSLMIGTAVGSKSMKEEQQSLIEKGLKYDPQAYRTAHQQHQEDYMDWNDDDEDVEDDRDHVDFIVEYTSRVDVLICTPGRLVDHLKLTRGFSLQHVCWLVVDEADRLLDQSFQRWVETVIPELHREAEMDPLSRKLFSLLHDTPIRRVQKVILSATMTKDIGKLASLRLRNPALIVLAGQVLPPVQEAQTTAEVSMEDHLDLDIPPSLKEVAIPVKRLDEKPLYLLHLLDGNAFSTVSPSTPGESDSEDSDYEESSSDESSSDDSNSDESKSESKSGTTSLCASSSVAPKVTEPLHHNNVLIFTNNNENALRLARLLCLLRPTMASKIASLTKSTATSSGRKLLAAFQKNRIKVLIASDRASRGLDIQDLASVVNYDMPTSLTSYIHRIGRTARAGKPGTATTFVAHHEAHWFWNEIAKSARIHRVTKVSRVEWPEGTFNDQDREAYETGLKQLGAEARE